LEGINISEAELHVGVDNKLGETKDLTAQMEGIPESGLFTLFSCESPEQEVSHYSVALQKQAYLTGFRFML
jgi:hypothetical protein